MLAAFTATAPAVEARGLGRRFGRRWALAHVDLEVHPGEVVLVAGPNGSGKTTMLRALAGLCRPTAGSVRIFGCDPERERLACRRRVAMISHDSYLYDRLTALETLRLWARLLGRRDSDATLRELLDEVGLADRAHSLVGGFSAGMRKRLCLARAHLERASLVLLDEPFSSLDAGGKRLAVRWLADLRARGAAVILASHTLEHAAPLCDRGILLREGQIARRAGAGTLHALLEEEP